MLEGYFRSIVWCKMGLGFLQLSKIAPIVNRMITLKDIFCDIINGGNLRGLDNFGGDINRYHTLATTAGLCGNIIIFNGMFSMHYKPNTTMLQQK